MFQSLGLLINLVEHCDLNRLKLLEMNTLPAYENATEVKETDAILSLVEVRLHFSSPSKLNCHSAVACLL